jgi:hypothetical protein
MAEIVLTLEELNETFWDFTIKALDLDPDAESSQDAVRTSYQTLSAPAFPITKNVVFIRIFSKDDLMTHQRDVEYSSLDSENTNRIVTYTRVHEVNWIAYGPNSYDYIEKIRNALYLPLYKDIFNEQNLFMVLDANAPIHIPETYGNQWWERSDLKVAFNEFVRREQIIPYIKTAEIQIKESEGDI